MMLGSVAAQVLSDLILERENPYVKLISPSRVKSVDGFTEFVKENADVAYRFVVDRFTAKDIDALKQIPVGQLQVVDYDGIKVAAYCDKQGDVHALLATCTHAGCLVNWNAAETSWDCPCHGARYGIDGNVITGPAGKSLQKLSE